MRPADLTFVAGELSTVLPTTARRLRTDPGGVVHPDHLAIGGTLYVKQVLLDSTAAHGSVGFVYPFANADDDRAKRDPPSTFAVTAGSTFQISERIYADATAAFTRTNRDRVSGGIVPRTDQYRVEVRPTAGIQIDPRFDLAGSASIPVAGKNTPQSYGVNAQLRFRF